jgi:heterodisulfide reductase subunit A
MYALKYAHLLKDKVGHDTEIYNFYIDMRCFGKGYEEFFKKVQSEGVRMVRGKASRVEEGDGVLTVTAEDTLSDRMLKVPVEMVILCTAMEARADANEVSRIFGISIIFPTRLRRLREPPPRRWPSAPPERWRWPL